MSRPAPKGISLPLAVGLALMLFPAASASAGTLSGETRDIDSTEWGLMRYRAEPGVANRVTVSPYIREGVTRSILVRDEAEPVRAAGDCVQMGRHSARCPWTASEPSIRVLTGDRSDRVRVKQACPEEGHCSHLLVDLRGGAGDDVLSGGGWFHGERGDDVLHGADLEYVQDHLHGGPGRDRMFGHGPSEDGAQDVFFDDETDRRAAPDVVVGGKSARAMIDYSMRSRPLRLDLHNRTVAPEGDALSGVKSAVGGAGDDVLIGTGGPNVLIGGAGDDRLEGRRQDDYLYGDAGRDLFLGGDGEDTLTEVSNLSRRSDSDLYVGGRGRDVVEALEPAGAKVKRGDRIRCDRADAPVRTDVLDRPRGCRLVGGWDGALEIVPKPRITRDSAVFTLRCGTTETSTAGPTELCRGRLRLRGTGGRAFGTREFEFPTSRGWTRWVRVRVALTAGGRAAIRARELVEVEVDTPSPTAYEFTPAGYRAVFD